MPLIVDLAGRDDELCQALDDLRLGRWFALREVLLKTGEDWPLRTARIQVLAVGAGEGGAVAAWLQEEPGSADALVMCVRTAKSWKRAGICPHPSTLTAVTRALDAHITPLVPYVAAYAETLALGSRCAEAIERAEVARGAPLAEDLDVAREYAFRLAVQVEVLLRYTEQHRERSGV
ncbi:DUF6415 family natural product biosynthesis protein [Streptomyces sp. 7R007]